MILNVHVGETVHVLKSGARRWKPNGPLMIIDGGGTSRRASEAPRSVAKRLGGGALSARLFVGLNVGASPKYTVDDVVKAVVEIRKKGGKSPDASFIAQRGTYTHDKSGKLIVEDSVQIIILDFSGDRAGFTRAMKTLGKRLRERFEQESVILEIQYRGIVEDVFGITAG